MKRLIKRSAPILILMIAASVYVVMRQSAAKPIPRPTAIDKAVAPYIEAQVQTVSATVHSQGTVEPGLRTELMARVAGQIVRVAPGFHAGGFFEAGALLLQIESQDYEAAVIQAEAVLAQAKLNLETEKARASQAERDWKALNTGNPTPLAMRRPQLAQVQAEIRAARAALEKSRRDVAKTSIRAPYALMIQTKHADLNQYVTPGATLAEVFGVETAEVRLPVTGEDLAQLDVAMGRARSQANLQPVPVALRARVAGRWYTWQGAIDRTEGIYDTRTRLTHVVARVDDPYGLRGGHQQPPLAVGMFVEADIQGRSWADRIVVSPQVMDEAGMVWVIDPDDTLSRRSISVIYTDSLHAVVADGLAAGDRVCMNTLEFPTEGMAVKPRAVASQDQEARR